MPKKQPEFFTWLRSTLRAASRRYPTLYKALAAAKRPYKGPNTRQKVEYVCAMCKQGFSSKEVSIDHIIDAGSLKCWEDLQGFAQRLFCSLEGLQVLCKKCHDSKSYSTKNNVTLLEASYIKQAINTEKLWGKEKIIASLKKNGYTDLSNASKRRTALIDYYTKEGNKNEN